MPERSYDFTRIYDEFTKYYCKGLGTCEMADKEYYQWLTDMGADESKDYAYCLESFSFARDKIHFYREDVDNKYYKILVGFPTKSMNGNVYKEADLQKSSQALVGLHPSLNHKDEFWFSPDNPLNKWGVLTIVDANYEDGATEAILQVPKTAVCPICDGKLMTELIDKKRIVNVSLEGGCRNYDKATGVCDGFTYDEQKGFTLLTTNILPGVPMARIFPLENIMREAFTPKSHKVDKKEGIKVKVRIKEQALPDITMPNADGGCPTGYSKGEDGKCVKVADIPLKGPSEDMVSPDETGTCPEGYEKTEDGKCKLIVATTEQAEDPNKPTIPAPTMPDEHGQCPEGMQFSAEQGFCVPSKDCPEGQHFDEEAQRCVADTEEKPEGTEVSKGSQVGDTSHKPLTDQLELSKARFTAVKAEAESMSLKEKLAFYEKTLAERETSVSELQGELRAVKTERDKLEHKNELLNTEANEKNRRIHDLTMNRDDLQSIVEKYKDELEKIKPKYSETLNANVEMSREVIESRNENTTLIIENRALKEKLSKGKRLAKIIAKT